MTIRQQSGVSRNSRRFLNDEEGSSALEYATMLGLVGMALLPVIQAVGERVSGTSRGLSDTLASSPIETATSSGSASGEGAETCDAPEYLIPDITGPAAEPAVMEAREAPGQPPEPEPLAPEPPAPVPPEPVRPVRNPPAPEVQSPP